MWDIIGGRRGEDVDGGEVREGDGEGDERVECGCRCGVE